MNKGGVGLGSGPTSAAARGGATKTPKAPIKLAELEERARAMCEKMFGETNVGMIGTMAYGFRKIWRKIYDSIQVEKFGLERLQSLVQQNPKQSVVTSRRTGATSTSSSSLISASTQDCPCPTSPRARTSSASCS